MAKKKDKPSDRFFRRYLGMPKNAKKLLRWQLPAELLRQVNWRSVRVKNTTFVDERLRMRESDLLIELSTKGGEPVLVFVLWEHQSKVDPMMAWRILAYRVEIWKQWLEANPSGKRLPFIHAIVLYQGKSAWNAELDFGQMIAFEKLGISQPPAGQQVRSEYSVVPVVELPELGWPEDLGLRLGLSLMRAVTLKAQADWIVEHGGDLNELLNQPGGGVSFQLVIEYVFVTEADEGKVMKALKETEPIVENKAMSIAEQLEKRGLEKGREEGLEKGREELIAAMLKNGASVNQIGKLTGLPLAEVKTVEAKLREGSVSGD